MWTTWLAHHWPSVASTGRVPLKGLGLRVPFERGGPCHGTLPTVDGRNPAVP